MMIMTVEFLLARRASLVSVLALTALNLSLHVTDATDARWMIAQVTLTVSALVAIFWEVRR